MLFLLLFILAYNTSSFLLSMGNVYELYPCSFLLSFLPFVQLKPSIHNFRVKTLHFPLFIILVLLFPCLLFSPIRLYYRYFIPNWFSHSASTLVVHILLFPSFFCSYSFKLLLEDDYAFIRDVNVKFNILVALITEERRFVPK